MTTEADWQELAGRLDAQADHPVWACSLANDPWLGEGLASRKLDYSLGQLGFFFDDHTDKEEPKRR